MPLGWNISVYRQQNDGSAPASFQAPAGTRLAIWQTGLGGLKWLDDLVREGKAVALGGNGYPLEYTALAGDILPRLRDEPPGAKPVWTSDPGDIFLPWYLGRTTKDVEAMDACRSDEWLVIQAWDES